MTLTPLSQPVEDFARLTGDLPDPELERSWSWQDYQEGVRFAFFRTYEELRELATHLTAQRSVGSPLTTAQRILGQHQAAYRDLRAILLPVGEDLSRRIPAEGEWSLRQIMDHVVRTEGTFFFVNAYALRRARGAVDLPEDPGDEAWDEFWSADPYPQILAESSFSALLAYYDALHERILHEFASIRDEELRAPATFWESSPMPIEFRLHRFDSHLRQHTIQVEKTLEALAATPNEARRLLRLVYNALAEVEAQLIGDWEAGAGSLIGLAGDITRRNLEVEAALRG